MSRVGVKFAFEWKRTPRRRWNVYSRPPSETVQDSARPGTSVVEPGGNSTRLLNTGRPALMAVVVVTICGLRDSGFPSEQKTRVFAVAGCARRHAAAARAVRYRVMPRADRH